METPVSGILQRGELRRRGCGTGQVAALKYARQHFGEFQRSNMAGIQRLMGCLCYLKRSNPYADLLSPERWEDFHRDFARLFCCLLGQALLLPCPKTTQHLHLCFPSFGHSQLGLCSDIASYDNDYPLKKAVCAGK